MSTYFSTSSAENKQNLLFKLSTFFANHSKGDIYQITRGIVWYLTIKRSKRISRKALGKFAKCHVDTVSSANMTLEEAGIFQIGRILRQNNIYEPEGLLDVLSYFFGYSVNFLLSSASQLNLTDNINITIDIKNSPFWVSTVEENNQKGEVEENLQENSQITSKALRNSIPVLCPDKATLEDIAFWNTEISDEERLAIREQLKALLG